jgi:integrase
MPKLNGRSPKRCHHKASNQDYVNLGGVIKYLGVHDSPEAKAAYDATIAEWLSSGRVSPARDKADGLLLKDLILGYFEHMAPTLSATEVDKLRRALGPARLFGDTPASEFGPVRYKAVRQTMVDAKLCTSTISARLGAIKRMIAWGVENEMLPGDSLHRLKAVSPLKAGRDARGPTKVKPVSDADIDAILPFLTPATRTMVLLQKLCGMRPGEAVRLTTGQIDRSVDPWIYRPSQHKTMHRGRDRAVMFGPRCQELLKPWLRADPDKPLFCPRESRQQSDANKPLSGRTTAAERARSRRYYRRTHKVSWRHAGEQYTTHSYGNSVHAACLRAGITPFRCNRLRHSFATNVRRQFGLEASQVLLGHSSADVTQIYAERDLTLAARVASQIG